MDKAVFSGDDAFDAAHRRVPVFSETLPLGANTSSTPKPQAKPQAQSQAPPERAGSFDGSSGASSVASSPPQGNHDSDIEITEPGSTKEANGREAKESYYRENAR